MEPQLTLAPHLAPLLDELRPLEDLYHAAYPDATPADFDRLVDPGFWEVGATGRCYSRAFARQVLTDRHGRPDPATWLTDEEMHREYPQWDGDEESRIGRADGYWVDSLAKSV